RTISVHPHCFHGRFRFSIAEKIQYCFASDLGHSTKIPVVPGPEQLLAYDMWFKKHVQRITSNPIDSAIVRMLTSGFSKLLESREVEEQLYTSSSTFEPHCIFWIKVKELVGELHSFLHHAHACFVSDTLMIAAALRPHIKKLRFISGLGSLSHCVWFHQPIFDVNEWMLYETKSASRAYITGKLWSRDGTLLLSSSQEALVRLKSM
ncbi:unnamed protein product, partial [Soboliphyme baturini]|uniref:Acyl-coenzyme A thioesterase 8 n=1 Tax=Soboliphyme baturini TaxID=241478 RepID=A0A183ITN3_9BILA